MKKVREFIFMFAVITTGIILICAIQFSLQNDGILNDNILWHILLAGALTAGATTLLLPSEECSKCRFILGIIVHFIVLCVIMVFVGVRFAWIPLCLEGVLGMVFCVAFVYAFTMIVTLISFQKEAKHVNQALQKKYNQDSQ